jgi:D-serine deaminase-like pyridoxal phosphate-dependent protein
MNGIHTTISAMDTPRVLLDRAVLLDNIRRMGDLAEANGLVLRPHAKTHKCVEIARLQQEEGATGLTVAKVEEAIVFLRAGIGSLTLAYPLVDPAKLDRLLDAARTYGRELHLLADSLEGINVLSDGAARHNVTLNVFLKIDVGLGRCGVCADDPRMVPLAAGIARGKKLKLAGLLSHAGHAYAANGTQAVQSIAETERLHMMQARDRLTEAGITTREISVGSTPTVLAAESFQGISEIRPGNYVFLDRTQMRLGVARPEEVALSVAATVVSANQDFFIIDAGSKTLSSDGGAHGSSGPGGFGLAFIPEEFPREGRGLVIEKLSEEHGFVRRDERELPLGTRLRILPNHACPVANLADSYLILSPNGETEEWLVAARGKVR